MQSAVDIERKKLGRSSDKQRIFDIINELKINDIDNIEFFAGDVEKILPEIIKRDNLKPNVVFVDPPRKGLDKKTIENILFYGIIITIL